ncbi:SGNH/GDSL hydrolase family protein [Agromyces sp. NPDC058136]|uniref:SGNH/GDSL hydrolase family protein n=1 Tax=Agromyces sp. NPDC058136 TaxID=3346354 RepID=UPI0036DBC525
MGDVIDRASRRLARRTLAVGVAVLAGVALAACSSPASTGSEGATNPAASFPSTDPTEPGRQQATSFAVVGDSITDANSPDLAGGDLGTESWARYVAEAGVGFAGGWAEWGAQTSFMADSVTAYDADVLVVLAGTNDLGFGVPFDESAAHLDRIVATVGIDDVVISSIPPTGAFPEASAQYNEQLEALADDRGWRFVDASAGLRNTDGGFADGMSYDGIHPSEQGARVLGAAIAAELLAG